MKPKFAGLFLAVALFVLALWLVLRPAPTPRLVGSVDTHEESGPSVRPPYTAEVVKTPPAPSSPSGTPTPVALNPVATALLSSSLTATDPPSENTVGSPVVRDAQIDAGKVRGMVHDFHTLMGENPVGTNAEIMRELMGGNPRQAQLGPPERMSLNGQGELIDQWNTPYFFHQLSRDLMEVHSAGPDKVFGTKDDIIVR